MPRRLTRVAVTLALVASLAVLGFAGGPVAPASADGFNHRSDWLRFPAPANFSRCTVRHLTLNGKYTWLIYYQYSPYPYGHPAKPRPVELHGRYRWMDCLHSYRPRPDITFYYRHRSWIRNERTGGELEWAQDVIEGGYGTPSGRYEWGSRLIHR